VAADVDQHDFLLANLSSIVMRYCIEMDGSAGRETTLQRMQAQRRVEGALSSRSRVLK